MIFPTSSSWLSGSSVSNNFQLQALCGEFFASKRHWSHWNSIKLRKSWNWRASSVSKKWRWYQLTWTLQIVCKRVTHAWQTEGELWWKKIKRWCSKQNCNGLLCTKEGRNKDYNITMQQCHDKCLRIAAHRIYNIIAYHIMCIYKHNHTNVSFPSPSGINFNPSLSTIFTFSAGMVS